MNKNYIWAVKSKDKFGPAYYWDRTFNTRQEARLEVQNDNNFSDRKNIVVKMVEISNKTRNK